MDSRGTLVVAVVAALAPAIGGPVSDTTSDRTLEQMRSRLSAAQVSVAGASRNVSAAKARRRRPPTVQFHDGRLQFQPGESGGTRARCGKKAPNAISGYFYVDEETTGDFLLNDFFPDINRAGDRARSWFTGVTNLSFEPHDWLAGVVCSPARVRYLVYSSTLDPLESDGRVITCPRRAPHALSGLVLGVSEEPNQVQVGDSFPAVGRRPGTTNPRGWVIGVKNNTDKPQEWLAGVVCTSAPVSFTIEGATLKPLEAAYGTSNCPRETPTAVSGLTAVVTETPGDAYVTGALQVSDFYPVAQRGEVRRWGVGVRNVTDQRQEWIWGVTCTR